MKKLLYGEGIYKKGEFYCYTDSKHTVEYTMWSGMLQRCYLEKKQRKHPTYTDCSVSENFKDFQYFAAWCYGQIGFKRKGFHLDKDVLIRGNKVYSENNCVFIPRALNSAIVCPNTERKDNLPVGVILISSSGKYRAEISIKGKNKVIGYYSEVKDAHSAYLIEKRKYLDDLLDQHRHEIDQRAYIALREWDFNVATKLSV